MKYLTCTFFIGATFFSFAQFNRNQNFSFNLSSNNPALMMEEGQLNLSNSFQSSSIKTNYTEFINLTNFSLYSKKVRSHFGFSNKYLYGSSDFDGGTKTTLAFSDFRFNKEIETTIGLRWSLAAEVGLFRLNIDRESSNPLIDYQYPESYRQINPTFGLGAAVTYNNVLLSLSYQPLLIEKQADLLGFEADKELIAGYKFYPIRNIEFSPMLRYRSGVPGQWTYLINTTYKNRITLGLNHGGQNVYGINLGIRISKITIGYGIQKNISGIKTFFGTEHAIYLRMRN